ncbi:calmodulin-dependent protein kinase [Aureococcus anophagefferens]|nr:calmodulin-dependent protein kinase [Aureococcus anophagefferens]
MSARFHRFADFAPDDVEWWQGEAGLLESYVGEWLPAVVRVRQGRVRVEAPVTGAERRFAAAVVAADAAAHLRFPAAAARDAFVAAVSSCAATARVGSGYRFGAVLGRGAQGVVRLVVARTARARARRCRSARQEKRVACREFELMRRVGRECATAHVRLLEAFECDAGGPKFDEEIESIRRLFRAVSGDGGEHLSIVDFGRVMAALDMPFTPDVLFPIYDRTRAGTVSAEDFARCVTAVRRAMVSDDAETFPPGSPAYEHAGLAFDAYHRALAAAARRAGRDHAGPRRRGHRGAQRGPRGARAAAPAPSQGETSPRGGRPSGRRRRRRRVAPRARGEATDGVDRETFIDGAIRRCPLLFGVFFLSVSYKMERLFERDAAPGAGRATPSARTAACWSKAAT